MTKDEVAICRLIYTRFLAQFLPPLTESKTRMDMKHGNAVFRVNGKSCCRPGVEGFIWSAKR